MFKILVGTFQLNLNNESQKTLELWEGEDYRITDGLPANFVWALEFKPGSRVLTKPIVVLAEAEWMVKWSRNGKNIRYCQVKRFPQNESTSHFLIVRELPEYWIARDDRVYDDGSELTIIKMFIYTHKCLLKISLLTFVIKRVVIWNT